MNYIGKVLNNVRDFYNDINAATLTGAIDVVVVEQPDGTFTCSPFHVRFGKLGVLRSREKVVDIEVNGEPLDIHMKLGESGEAFFVEEIPRAEAEACPAYLACSPIPSEGEQLMMAQFGPGESPPDLSPPDSPPSGKACDRELFPSQPAPPLSPLHENKESNPQQPKTFRAEPVSEKPNTTGAEFRPIQPASQDDEAGNQATGSKNSRRKRRRKSQMKKKSQQQQKKSSPSNQEEGDNEAEDTQHSSSATPPPVTPGNGEQQQQPQQDQLPDDQIQFDMEDVESESRPACTLHLGGIMLSGSDNSAQLTYSRDCKECEQRCSQLGLTSVSETESVPRKPADLHFFSDTEATPGCSVELLDVHQAASLALCDPALWPQCNLPPIPHGSRPGSPAPQSDSELELQRQSSAAEQTQLEAQLQAELGANGKQSWKWGELPSPPPPPMLPRHSQDVTAEQAGPQAEQSEQQQQTQQQQRSSVLSGMWSLMRSHNRHRAAQPEGVYLDELDVNSLDPEVAALYFPPSYRGGHRASTTDQPKRPSLTESGSREEEDTESGKGPSLSQSPHSVEGAIGGPKMIDSDYEDLRLAERKLFPDLAISLCGPLDPLQPPTEEAFSCALVSYAELQQNPAMLENPSLVVRLHGRLQTWKEAAPEVISLLLFQQPLLQLTPTSPKEDLPTEMTASSPSEEVAVVPQVTVQNPTQSSASEPSRYSWFSWARSGSVSKKSDLAESRNAASMGRYHDEEDHVDMHEVTVKDVSVKEGEGYSGSNSSDESDNGAISIPGSRKRMYEQGEVMYRKTLRLSSDQIKSLLLKEGANEVVFSVTTAYQGTSRCKCHVYRWRWDDKIVISDIDGTITKSDVLGHILPIVGKDWAQSGVAQLFTKVKNNGYRLLYLSARAIGQARVTREYLKSIKQGDLSLPEGPLLLSPTSLISAFHREVIEKKPEEFKISCLRDIQALFPSDSKPFYAGYGNKINDVWAYRAVGIPIFRIFTINHKGELKHELTQTFQSSYFGQSDAVDELFPPIKSAEYSNMSYIVDQMFPPPPEDTAATEDFNNFNYWREPVPELDPALLPPVPTSPSTKGRTPVKEVPSPSVTAK